MRIRAFVTLQEGLDARACYRVMSCAVQTSSRSASNPSSATASRDFADERHVNVSAWARDVIAAALDREFPAALEAPKRQPLAGWRPCKLDDGWGAVLDGPDVAALAEDPRGTPISITDSRGGSWTATITEVVSRNQQRIVVRDTGRP